MNGRITSSFWSNSQMCTVESDCLPLSPVFFNYHEQFFDPCVNLGADLQVLSEWGPPWSPTHEP
jgi:hypothetical protein